MSTWSLHPKAICGCGSASSKHCRQKVGPCQLHLQALVDSPPSSWWQKWSLRCAGEGSSQEVMPTWSCYQHLPTSGFSKLSSHTSPVTKYLHAASWSHGRMRLAIVHASHLRSSLTKCCNHCCRQLARSGASAHFQNSKNCFMPALRMGGFHGQHGLLEGWKGPLGPSGWIPHLQNVVRWYVLVHEHSRNGQWLGHWEVVQMNPSEANATPSLFGHQATNANHWTRSQHVLSWRTSTLCSVESCWSWCGSCERHVAWNVEVVDPQAPSSKQSKEFLLVWRLCWPLNVRCHRSSVAASSQFSRNSSALSRERLCGRDFILSQNSCGKHGAYTTPCSLQGNNLDM